MKWFAIAVRELRLSLTEIRLLQTERFRCLFIFALMVLFLFFIN